MPSIPVGGWASEQRVLFLLNQELFSRDWLPRPKTLWREMRFSETVTPALQVF